MSEIQKGIILTLEGEKDRNNNYTMAKVQATSAEGTSSLPITIPWYLRGSMGNLQKGIEVAYAMFDDCSGVIISRMDGNWDGKMEESQLVIDLQGNTATVQGNMNIEDNILADKVSANNITDSGKRLATHTHSGVLSGSESTGQPN